MSRPRAATDVAMRIGARPLLKSRSASSLSRCWRSLNERKNWSYTKKVAHQNRNRYERLHYRCHDTRNYDATLVYWVNQRVLLVCKNWISLRCYSVSWPRCTAYWWHLCRLVQAPLCKQYGPVYLVQPREDNFAPDKFIRSLFELPHNLHTWDADRLKKRVTSQKWH